MIMSVHCFAHGVWKFQRCTHRTLNVLCQWWWYASENTSFCLRATLNKCVHCLACAGLFSRSIRTHSQCRLAGPSATHEASIAGARSQRCVVVVRHIDTVMGSAYTHTKLTPRWRLLHVTNDGNAFALAARQTIFVELSAFRAQMQPQHIYNVNAHTLFMSNQIVNDASACLFNVNVCCQYSLTHSSRWALVIRRRRRRRLRWCTDVHNQQSISASSTLLVAYIVRTYIQSVSPSSVVGPLRWPSNWINGSWENCTESVEGNIWCCEIVFGAMTKVTYILSHGVQRCRASGYDWCGNTLPTHSTVENFSSIKLCERRRVALRLPTGRNMEIHSILWPFVFHRFDYHQQAANARSVGCHWVI